MGSMSYIPSDFDNLDEGFSLLDVRENNQDLLHYEGGYTDKGLGYKQQFQIYGINYDPLMTHNTKIDFCFIFKGSTIDTTKPLYLTTVVNNVQPYESIDLKNVTHTVTQDTAGHTVWLYEDFDFSGLQAFYIDEYGSGPIWNNVPFRIMCTYVGIQEYYYFISTFKDTQYNDDEQKIVLKFIEEPTVNFSIARKDNISELMEVTFSGTFDNSNLGIVNNSLLQISLHYIDPINWVTKQIDLVRDVDYTISGNTFYSGTGSSASTIDVDIEEMFYQGIRFVLYAYTEVNDGWDEDETYSNLPVFDWGKSGNTKYLNVNGDLKINDTNIFSLIYPVGSIYISTSMNSSTEYVVGKEGCPLAEFFGTWERFAIGRTLVGVDDSQTEFDTVEETGGEKKHTLTINEMPTHTHQLFANKGAEQVYNQTPVNETNGFIDEGTAVRINWQFHGTADFRDTTETGGGQAHNILQPYITVYMWKRTA